MKQKIVLLSVLIASLFTACTPKPEQKDVHQAVSEALVEVEQVSLEGENQVLNLDLPECNGNNCPEIDVERLSSNQPYIDAWVDAEILKLLQQILSIAPDPKLEQQVASAAQAASEVQAKIAAPVTAKTTLEQQLKPYVGSFLYLDQELKDLSANHQISVMVKPRILNHQGPLATVVLNSSSYLGGAHGSSSQQYANFDLAQSKQILLKDIVLPKQHAALEKAGYAVFKQWVTDSKLAENIGDYEQAWKFHLSDNFYLSQQGLILQYAEYEIGPYVVGLPKLVIAYEDLTGILKPEYLPVTQQDTQTP
jgi:hypothetical protein